MLASCHLLAWRFEVPAEKPGRPAQRTFSEDVQAHARAIGETVIVFIGLAYLCGFIVVYTFENKLGIHDTNSEIIRIRYIHTGLLCLAFPIFVVIPIAAHIWMYRRQRPILEYYERLKKEGLFVGRSRLAYTVQLCCVCLCLFFFVLFEPYGKVHSQLVWIVVLLFLAVVPVVGFRKYLGFSADSERPRLRILLALASVIVLVGALWGTIGYLLPIFFKGLSYWLFTAALTLYLVGSVSQKPLYWFVGQKEGVQIARWAVVFTLFMMSVLAFAYRVYPLIPADKGGGNFRFSRDVQICMLAGEKVATEISVKREDLTCTVPVKVLDITDSTLYVARKDDKGHNESGESPLPNRQEAAEIWSDGEFFPTVYAIPRSKTAFVQYDIVNNQKWTQQVASSMGIQAVCAQPAMHAAFQRARVHRHRIR